MNNLIPIADETFLKQVKAILVYFNFISIDTVIDAKSWLQFKQDGYKALDAVREDMDDKTLWPQWSKVYEIMQSQ